MNHTAEPAPSGAPPGYIGLPNPAPRPAARCGWCESTHISEAICTCKEPCARGWCPVALMSEATPAAADPTRW